MAKKSETTLSADQKKAYGKLCTICYQCITVEDIKLEDFVLSKTKRNSIIAAHKHCFKNEIGGLNHGRKQF